VQLAGGDADLGAEAQLPAVVEAGGGIPQNAARVDLGEEAGRERRVGRADALGVAAAIAGDVPERWRPLLALNPMTGVIEGFRWALLGTGDPPLTALAASSALVVVLLATGLMYFRRMERTFADVI